MKAIERENTNRAADPAPPAGRKLASQAMEAVRRDGGWLLKRAGWGLAILVALISAGVCAGGCGQRNEPRSASTQAPEPAVATAQTHTDPIAASVSSASANEPASGALAAASADSLAPDVAATVTDDHVFAGTSAEITAQGSPDVVGVVLGDGNGGKAPFAYDPGADLWRVAYRVPVRPKSDRLALSVTARNTAGRWHRVWVFLNVEQEAAKADSVSTEKP